jgi:signal transduction histidine kinase/ligand-binding sensor domain-containing protein
MYRLDMGALGGAFFLLRSEREDRIMNGMAALIREDLAGAGGAWIRCSSVLWVLLFISSGSFVFALNPDRDISQYAHAAWRAQEGAFRGAPNAIAQTQDGYLWIGTDLGLVRFDGVRFVPWSPPSSQRLLDPRIFSLLGTRDGSLWIGTGYSVSRWQRGKLLDYPQISGRIEALAEDTEGAVWLVRTQITDDMGPVCRIKSEQSQCYGKPEGIPFPIALHLSVGNSGELWIGGYSELCRWKPGSSAQCYFSDKSHRPETFASLKAIAAGRDGSIWVAQERPGSLLQLQLFEHEKWTTRNLPGIAVNNADVTNLFVDRDASLWIGTANHGMFRVQGDVIDHYGRADGLSSDAAARFYEDAEGTIWVVTSEGIDKFSDVKVVSYSMREGLSAAGAGTVLATRDGAVWIGNFHALDMVRDDKLSAIRGHALPGLYVTTFFEDHAGMLWVGIDNGLWVYHNGVFRAVRHDDGSALGIVFAITEDTLHNIWVRAGRNLDRIYDAQLQAETTSPQISSTFILAANPVGGIYLGLTTGDLIQYKDGKTLSYPSNEVGNTRQIRDLLVEADGSVWGTTLDELARWKNGTRKNLTTRNGLPCDGIFALVKDDRGSLWLDAKCGLVEVEKSELDSWWEHPESMVKVKVFDALDGAQPGLTPLKPQATKSTDGRLWFVNGRILQMLDPANLHRNPVPPPVQIEEVHADRRNYSSHSGLRLPARTGDLEIDYTALSYVSPQKILFRYMLEGHDTVWQEPGARRQAFYNDLEPGPYRFRVMACNNDGVWNEAGASLDFSVLPAFYQTLWFRLACVVASLLMLWAIYRFRVRQLQRQFVIGLEARVNERTRIARELHDTLLQTLHGLMFQFQAVRNLLPRRTEDAMLSLDEAIHETEKALTESRDAIQGLRSEPIAKGNLAELLAAAGRELAHPGNDSHEAPVFELIEEGERCSMSPTATNDVCRIAIELIRNAFRHSQATRIEAEIRYDDQVLRVRVRDNGSGIDPKVLKAGGIAGHWGLRGIRERAERIGAQLEFWSKAGAGTEVELTVPAIVAYETSRDGMTSRFRRRMKDRAQPS